ncbi:MAG: hypothetical protein U0871_01600 [Gemmataceae bacterium]
MNEQPTKTVREGWPHPDFITNTNNFPTAELWKYIGQYIAWNWDGTEILTAAPTEEEVFARLADLGVPGDKSVVSYVSDPDLVYI